MTPLQTRVQQAAIDYLGDESNGGWGISVDELAKELGESKATIKGTIGSLVKARLGYTEHDGRHTDCYYPIAFMRYIAHIDNET